MQSPGQLRTWSQLSCWSKQPTLWQQPQELLYMREPCTLCDSCVCPGLWSLMTIISSFPMFPFSLATYLIFQDYSKATPPCLFLIPRPRYLFMYDFFSLWKCAHQISTFTLQVTKLKCTGSTQVTNLAFKSRLSESTALPSSFDLFHCRVISPWVLLRRLLSLLIGCKSTEGKGLHSERVCIYSFLHSRKS